MRFLLGLILAGLVSGVQAGPDERDRILEAVDLLRARGELERARDCAVKGRELFPADLSIHVRYQDVCRALGREVSLREEYRRAWVKEKTPQSTCLYARLLKGEAAVREYKQALAKDPHFFWAHYGLGVALLRQGKLEPARDSLERALSLEPRQPMPHIRMGQLEERCGAFEDALACYERADLLAPQQADALLHQVFVLLGLGRKDEARVAAQEMFARPAPDALPLGCIARGVLHASEGDAERAAQAFARAVEGSLRYGPHALALLGEQLFDLGRLEEAAAAFARALDRDPTHMRARMGLGYLLYRRGEFDAADREFAETIDRIPKEEARAEAEPLFFRGVIAEEDGRPKNAIWFYREAIERDGEVADYRLALAALYEALDMKAAALREYKRARELDPGDALACLQAGLLEADLKRGAQALTLFDEALTRDPGLLDAYLAAGSTCQDLLSRPADALDYYRLYLAKGGSDARVHDWIAELER